MVTMSRKILVTHALPYANGPLHLGPHHRGVQTDVWVRDQGCAAMTACFVCAEDGPRHAHHDPRAAGRHHPRSLIAAVAREHARDYAASPSASTIPLDAYRGEPALTLDLYTKLATPATSRAAACARPTTSRPACSCPTAT